VTNSGPNNTSIATRTWVATDACGNQAQCSQNVTLLPCAALEGCSPGFWKTHAQLWDGSSKTLPSITYRTTMSFNAALGVTALQSGKANNVTLLQAIQTGGGGLNALGRQTVSALLNSQSVNYPLSLSTVILRYRVAVGAIACPPIPAGLSQCDTVDGLEGELDKDNNLEGPLCNATGKL
jgi:hypothetical protein